MMIKELITRLKTVAPGFTASYDGDRLDPDHLIFSQWHRMVNANFPYTAGGDAVSGDPLDIIDLIPRDTAVLRHCADGDDVENIILAGNSDLLVIMRLAERRDLRVFTAAKDPLIADRELHAIIDPIQPPPPPPRPETDRVRIEVWQYGMMGPESFGKVIQVPKFDEVERNYPEEVAQKLLYAMRARRPTEDAGKIILWYGEPGTGKTNAIRSLMREWKGWCSFHYISDPEKLFELPSYLLHVGAGDGRYRLVIAEDTDEFLKLDAREAAGAAMGRLLNFSDGILGQGSNTFFLLTTNERADNLHPAITRPGRCFQAVKFRPFSTREAIDWMSDEMSLPQNEDPDKTGYTLAELIAYRKGTPELPAPRLDSDEVEDDYDSEESLVSTTLAGMRRRIR